MLATGQPCARRSFPRDRSRTTWCGACWSRNRSARSREPSRRDKTEREIAPQFEFGGARSV